MFKNTLLPLVMLMGLVLMGTTPGFAQGDFPTFHSSPVIHFDSTKSSQYPETAGIEFRKADNDTTVIENIADILDDLGVISMEDSTVYLVLIPEPRTDPAVADAADSVDMSLTIQLGNDWGLGFVIDTAITIRHNTLGSTYKTFKRIIGDLAKNSTKIRTIIVPENTNTPNSDADNRKKWQIGFVATKPS